MYGQPSCHMSARNHAERKAANTDEESNESCAKAVSLQHTNPVLSSSTKEQRSKGLADAQIWRWKSHYKGSSNPKDRKENGLGYDTSVHKRRAQNRASQKAFRARQKRTYHDLEARNEELAKSMSEALEEISRLRSLVDSVSSESRACKEGTPTPPIGMKQDKCSAKCYLKATSAGITDSSMRHLLGQEKAPRSLGRALSSAPLQCHTNACLFQRTAIITCGQDVAQHSSASNEAAATMQLARSMCFQYQCPPPQPALPLGDWHLNGQAAIPVAVPWLWMDASIAADQFHESPYPDSISSASLRQRGPICGIVRKCLSCLYMQYGYDCHETRSSHFPSTSPTDNNTPDTPSPSPDPKVDAVQFCAGAPQVRPRSTDASDSSAGFPAIFDEMLPAFSNDTIPSYFEFDEMDCFEALA